MKHAPERNHFRSRRAWHSRAGFTLVELMVAMAIFLILTTLTVTAINGIGDEDLIAAASRQTQAYFEGARSRASAFGHPVGVRILVDDDLDGHASTSLLYVEQAEPDVSDMQFNTTNPESGKFLFFVANPFEGATGSPRFIKKEPAAGETGELDGFWLATTGRLYQEWKRLMDERGAIPQSLLLSQQQQFPNRPVPRVRISLWLGVSPQVPIQAGPVPPAARAVNEQRRFGARRFTINAIVDTGNRYLLWLADKFPLNSDIRGTHVPFSGPDWTMQPEQSAAPPDNRTVTPVQYELETVNTPVADQEPTVLPQGVVIDLDGSRLPDAWRPPLNNRRTPYTAMMDIMFASDGTLHGESAAMGLVHLLMIKLEDAQVTRQDRPNAAHFIHGGPLPSVPAPWEKGTMEFGAKGPLRLLTVYGSTGQIDISPAFQLDADNNGYADNPFLYAREGETAR